MAHIWPGARRCCAESSSVAAYKPAIYEGAYRLVPAGFLAWHRTTRRLQSADWRNISEHRWQPYHFVLRDEQSGVLVGSHFWFFGRAYANWLNLVLFVLALSVTLWLAIGPDRDNGRRILFPFFVIGAVILASCATVSALWTTHFAVLSPWPALAIAAAADLFVRRSGLRLAARKRTSLALVLMLIVIGASWIADVVADARYHHALASSGGLGAHSDAVYDLAGWLAADGRPNEPVVAMDWGIAASVAFLTQGEVTPVEAFGYDWETDADFAARLEPYISNPGSIYLWRAPDEIIFDRSGEFRRLYEPHGLDEDILGAFYERSGRPVLGATGLVPDGSALNPPQSLNGE
jgi:hypothetical protein